MPALESLLQRLVQGQVEFVVVGGFAAVAHGVTLVTQDLDICLNLSQHNLLRLQETLADLHPVHRMTPQRVPLEITEANAARFQNVYLETDLGQLDCLGEVKGIGDFSRVSQSAIQIDLADGSCNVLGLEALIRTKEAMDRPHDRQTVLQLRAIQQRQAKR